LALALKIAFSSSVTSLFTGRGTDPTGLAFAAGVELGAGASPMGFSF